MTLEILWGLVLLFFVCLGLLTLLALIVATCSRPSRVNSSCGSGLRRRVLGGETGMRCPKCGDEEMFRIVALHHIDEIDLETGRIYPLGKVSLKVRAKDDV